uniref:Tryptophan synthase (EC) n=1 Tax=Ganoderma boninense TaxID=34458 RepID=A0A5K1K3U9_9APHY|nr:Tryptophan synthase (EC [Ganoderma boninense]
MHVVGWDDDDETALVTMLQENTSEQDEEERLIALIESLKGPMAAQGASLKQYMKDTFLPAYNGIKTAHGVLEDKVDLAFGAGLLTFDEVCKKVERIALRDEDELKTAHAEAQRNMARTLEELEHAYARRKELWAALEEDVNRCGNLIILASVLVRCSLLARCHLITSEATRAAAALEGLPTDVEQTIALLEKKAKALDKDTSAAANQKMLRGLLEKM